MCVVAAGARLASCMTPSDSTALWMAWVGPGAASLGLSGAVDNLPTTRSTDRQDDRPDDG